MPSTVISNFKQERHQFIWESYGVLFQLDLKGNLTLTPITNTAIADVHISIKGTVFLGGEGFNNLHIESKKIVIAKDFSANQLVVKPIAAENRLDFAHVKQGAVCAVSELKLIGGHFYNFGTFASKKEIRVDFSDGRFENHHIMKSDFGIVFKGRGIFINFKKLQAPTIETSSFISLNGGFINGHIVKASSHIVTNPGEIQTTKNININSHHFNNANGKAHSAGTVSVSTVHLNIDKGSLSGVEETDVMVQGSFSSRNGKLGVQGTTRLCLENPVEELGTIEGTKVAIETSKKAKSSTLKNGTVYAEEVSIFGNEVLMPMVTFLTPLLSLHTTNFQLDPQIDPKTFCPRTVLNVSPKRSVLLTHDYRTLGVFEIQEYGISDINVKQIMKERFGDGTGDLPKFNYLLDIQASMRADKGGRILAPSAKLRCGDNKTPKASELLFLDGTFEAYVSEMDIEKGGIVFRKAFIWAPNGTTLGRLVEDPTRQVFATFYAHAQRNSSCNLSTDNVTLSYTFLGKNAANPYDSRHLLVMPVATTNGSFLQAKELVEIIGQYIHYGALETQNLKITSMKPSLLETSTIWVESDCTLVGNFTLQRTLSVLNMNQYSCHRSHCAAATFTFCNSDPASLTVKGRLLGNAVITNHASKVHASETSHNVKVNSKDFTASLYQKFISGTLTERQNIKNSYQPLPPRFYSGQHHGNVWGFIGSTHKVASPTNYIHDYAGGLPYAVGFLINTHNFAGAQQVFLAITSNALPVVLSSPNIEGMFSAPATLITVGKNPVAIGSSNPYHLNPQNPIRDLLAKGFNIHTTYVAKNLKKIIEKAKTPKFHFIFRERYWFDDEHAQTFFRDIAESMVVITIDGRLKKPEPQTILSLSPKFLIKRVREETQDVLMRSYIEEGRIIDEKYVKELHRNIMDYLKQTNFINTGFKDFLTGKTSSIILPTKPLIYYQALINDQRLEELHPFVYFPPKLINEVCAQLFKTNFLLIFSENLTPTQLIELAQARPALQTSLIQFFDVNTKTKKYLEHRAKAIQYQRSKEQLIEYPGQQLTIPTNQATPQGTVTLAGNYNIGTLAALVEGKISVTGNVETQDALLASLYDTVEFKSRIARIGNNENFDDVLYRARIAAQNILCVFAGKDVVFEATETQSGLGTYIQALGDLLDLPVTLVRQRVERFFGRRSGTLKNTFVTQSTSSHKTGGDFLGIAQGSAILYAPKVEAENAQIVGANTAAVLDVTEQSEHEALVTKKGMWNKKKTSHALAVTQRSKGAEFRVKRLLLAGQTKVNLSNITSSASTNIFYSPEGLVSIMQGQNRSFATLAEQSYSNLFWQKEKSEITKQITYSQSVIPGAIQIYSKQTMLDLVRGKTLDFVQRIEPKKGGVSYNLLEEQYDYQEHSIQGPTEGLIVVVSLAVTLATAGTGASLGAALGFAAGGLGNAMIAAGFSSLCSQAAVAILASEGDPAKAIKSLSNSATVKSFAISVLSAGLMHKISSVLELPPAFKEKSFLQQAEYNIARASVNAILNMSINRQSSHQALSYGVVDAVVGAVAGVSATKIGSLYGAEQINSVIHKTLHALLGGASGVVLGGRKGAVAGTLGSLIVETSTDMFKPQKPVMAKKIKMLEAQKQRRLTFKEFNVYYEAEIEAYRTKLATVSDWSRLTSATTALITAQDVPLSIQTATQSIENDFSPTAWQGITSSHAAYFIYLETSIAEDTRLKANQNTLAFETWKPSGVSIEGLGRSLMVASLGSSQVLASSKGNENLEPRQRNAVLAKLDAEYLSNMQTPTSTRDIQNARILSTYADSSRAQHLFFSDASVAHQGSDNRNKLPQNKKVLIYTVRPQQQSGSSLRTSVSDSQNRQLTIRSKNNSRPSHSSSIGEQLLNFFIPAAEASELSSNFQDRQAVVTTTQSNTKKTKRVANTKDIFQRREELLQQMNTSPELATAPMVAGVVAGAVADTAHGVLGIARVGLDAILSTGLEGLVPQSVQAAAQERTQNRVVAVVDAVTNYERTTQRVSDALGAEFKTASENYAQGNYFTAGYNLRSGVTAPSVVGSGYQVAKLGTRLGTMGVRKTSQACRDFAASRDFRSPFTLQYDAARLNSGIPIDIIKLQTPWWVKKAQIGDGIPRANSAADALRLKVELFLKQGNLLDEAGKLTKSALSNVRLLRKGEELQNPKVIAELVRDGSKIEDWAKYTTREAVLVNGQKIQVHFYMNEKTGKVNYAIDYKSVPEVPIGKPSISGK